jgi:hypothetical protein
MATLGWSQTYALAMMNAMLRGQAWPTQPAGTFLKFHLDYPGINGTANAALHTTRYSVTFGAATISGNFAICTNTNTITLTGVSNTENFTHCGIWSASSGGLFVRSGLVSGGSVASGTSPTLQPGQIVVYMLIST